MITVYYQNCQDFQELNAKTFQPINHLTIHSSTASIHPRNHSFIHQIIHSYIKPFIHPSNHSFILQTLHYSFNSSSIYPFIHCIDASIKSFTHTYNHSFIHQTIHSSEHSYAFLILIPPSKHRSSRILYSMYIHTVRARKHCNSMTTFSIDRYSEIQIDRQASIYPTKMSSYVLQCVLDLTVLAYYEIFLIKIKQEL